MVYAVNVPKKGGWRDCFEKVDGVEPGPIPGLAYDNCYNVGAVSYANLKRGQAGAAELVLDTSVAAKAQAWADALLARAAPAPSTAADGRDPAVCGENVFDQSVAGDRAGMRTSTAPADYWYGGSAHYDFTKNLVKENISAEEALLASEFTRLVWKASTKVGFGISKDGRYVVAWFCEEPGNVMKNDYNQLIPANAATNAKNVGKNCINKDGVNECFNKLNTDKLLEIRATHDVKDPIKNTLDDGYAKALQELVNKRVADDEFLKDGEINFDEAKMFAPTASIGGVKTYRLTRTGDTPELAAASSDYDDCTELLYEAKEDGTYELLTDTGAVAVSAWYA